MGFFSTPKFLKGFLCTFEKKVRSPHLEAPKTAPSNLGIRLTVDSFQWWPHLVGTTELSLPKDTGEKAPPRDPAQESMRRCL